MADTERTVPTMEHYDADEFAGYLITQGLADNSVRNYRCLYQRWLDWCVTEERDAANPDPISVREWSNTIHTSRAMLMQAAAMMNHVCEMTGAEPVGGAIRVPRRPRRPSRALPVEQARALVETALNEGGQEGSAVLVGLYTAARRSEIAGMEWEHVEFPASRITFWRDKTRDWHTVPLHPVLHEHLEARWLEGSQWLFPGRWGGHVSPATIWRWIRDFAERAGAGKVTPHQLRHTALTLMNDRSHDLRATQEVAGHVKPETTSRYTHVREQRMRDVVGQLNYLGETETNA